jgi:hypothetical protein
MNGDRKVRSEKKNVENAAEKTGEAIGKGIKKGAKAVENVGKGIKKELKIRVIQAILFFAKQKRKVHVTYIM